MSILEAMSAGLPVVSTPVGGIPEAVISGETGLLVEPGNSDALSEALLTILSDSALGEEMGRKGRILQQQSFSSESMGSRCLALYRRCEEKHTSISR
jgi:glycosyltransferase involved in cell wall biosynthesis